MGIDSNIWVLIEEGDVDAYEQMYSYYFRRFHIYGQKITNHAVLIEDAIQEIMIFIWKNRSTLSQIKHPPAYFYTSFRNLLINKIKEQGTIFSDEHIQEDIQLAPEQAIVHRDELDERQKQLNQVSEILTARQYEAIFLRFYEGLSYEEVAAVMNITVKATYKIMARAIKELKSRYVPLLFILLQFYDYLKDVFVATTSH